MAPSVEEWEALSPAERAAMAAALPGEVTDAEIAMPRASDTSRRKPARSRRCAATSRGSGVGSTSPRRCRPTIRPSRASRRIFAVLDVDDTVRDKWVVSAEGKGFDWVLEIHVGGDRKKDAERNVARYARLGIPEYFLYDGANNRLAAYRLASPDARVYTAVLPNHGLYESRVLGLDVQVEKDRLRFYAGTALLLESDELIVRLQELCDDAQRRREEEAQLREEEARLREEVERRREEAERLRQEERRRREEAEQEVARLRAELERLKR
jgi:hypothetical protein